MIPVKNVYYMLAYAFQALQNARFQKLETETFENAQDMFAAILLTGTSALIRQGLKREYVQLEEPLSSPRGKLQISASLTGRFLQKRELVCVHDEFTENCYFNGILKTTFTLLLKLDIPARRKKEIRSILGFFGNVELLEPDQIQWQLAFTRLDAMYRMLLAICELIIKGRLQSQNRGSSAAAEWIDEQRMSRLYEKFILEYYRKEHPDLKVSVSQIDWQLDDGFQDLLPVMRSDIMLEKDDKVLIIDAKYYQQNLQTNFDHQTIHSGNLYQIFTYVKNKDTELQNTGAEVSGMLLYAKTAAAIQPDQTYRMSGNTIAVKTLDLALPFQQISRQLDAIAFSFFDAKQPETSVMP